LPGNRSGIDSVYAAREREDYRRVIDTYCYAMSGLRRRLCNCAIECAKNEFLQDCLNGIKCLRPLPGKQIRLPQAVFDKMAHKVTITGKMVSRW
jgi:hypothetical protein